jgi:predicted transcriptional regulator
VADYQLTELQLEIMQFLWERGEASAGEVRAALRSRRELAHTTVSTMLRRLENKGIVQHRVEGREFRYAPAVEPARVQRTVMSGLQDLLDRLFEGDVAHAVSHLLEESEVDADGLARVREMIDRKEEELKQRQGEDR